MLTLSVLTATWLLASGCGADTVWENETRSPDGRYVAIARTLQNGGFGSASVDTSVSLQQANIPRTGTIVLDFYCDGPVPHPYILDNVANAGGTISLKMKWITPSHLDVTYHGDANIGFQAVRYQGIDISLEEP